MLTKRAVAKGTIVAVISLAILGIVLFFQFGFTDKVFAGVDTLQKRETCKQGNLANVESRTTIPGTDTVIAETIRSKCVTNYLTEQDKVAKGKELNTIANEMASCWDMYLEGKAQIFETRDENVCAICTVMEFENKAQIAGLMEHLQTKKSLGTGKTYFEHLSGIEQQGEVRKVFENQNLKEYDYIDTSLDYAVIYTESIEAYPGGVIEADSTFTALPGVALGLLSGAGVVIGGAICLSGFFCPAGVGLMSLSAKGLAVSGVVGTAGYFLGSDQDPQRDSRVVLWPYTKEELAKLKCTQFEGRNRLDIVT